MKTYMARIMFVCGRPKSWLLVIAFTLALACSAQEFVPPAGERVIAVGQLMDDEFWREHEPFWLAGCHADISADAGKAFSNSGRHFEDGQTAIVMAAWPPPGLDDLDPDDLGCLVMRVKFSAEMGYCYGYGYGSFRPLSRCPESEQELIPRFGVTPNTEDRNWAHKTTKSKIEGLVPSGE